ncbi:conserved hypothetical protein [Burkholderia pseudomallei MSHR346]|nr:conserved hypothetical protein [Burkholderia pseudomallei MSHR346]
MAVATSISSGRYRQRNHAVDGAMSTNRQIVRTFFRRASIQPNSRCRIERARPVRSLCRPISAVHRPAHVAADD